MTSRNKTQKVLNEFFLSGLGGMALGAAGMGAVAGYLRGQKKGTGLSYRLGERLKDTTFGSGLQKRGIDALIRRSNIMQTQAHQDIAAKYGLSPSNYASALESEARKNSAIDIANKLKALGHDPTQIHVDDAESILAGHTIPTRQNISPEKTIHSLATSPSKFDILDVANPEAKEFRERKTKDIFIPQQSSREGLFRQRSDVETKRSDLRARLEQDRINQAADLKAERYKMPSVREPGIDKTEMLKRLMKRGSREIVDRLRSSII